MATLSLLEKLAIIFEVSKSSIVFLVAIMLLIFFGLVLITTNKLNVKTSRRLFILIYIFIFACIIVLYKDSFSTMVTYLMNNLFKVIYFPNLAIYLFAIFIMNIILWYSVFSFKSTNIIKNVNIIIYIIINYLLVVLLDIINKQKLDVFNQASIYGNKSAQAVIELSSLIFIVWIIFLVLYKAIMVYLTRNNKLPKVIKKKKDYQEEPVMIKTMPMYANTINTGAELEKYDNLFTLEDYKYLLEVLKNKQEKKPEKVVTKVVETKQEKKEKELAKFRELQELYGVR
ncbi:MAG: hypothetical protein IKH54_05915 [Bacilli bacterium]|nr:hypothetical protein [Bacilli bacterium]